MASKETGKKLYSLAEKKKKKKNSAEKAIIKTNKWHHKEQCPPGTSKGVCEQQIYVTSQSGQTEKCVTKHICGSPQIETADWQESVFLTFPFYCISISESVGIYITYI